MYFGFKWVPIYIYIYIYIHTYIHTYIYIYIFFLFVVHSLNPKPEGRNVYTIWVDGA